jgi:NAD(P)-dependent dehydrogenase (short-subunit alcohol dehydrogenase family)
MVCLVTGAGRGIGRAIALELARQKARPILTSRSSGHLVQTAAAIKELTGLEPLCVQADLAKEQAIDALVAKVGQAYQRLDALINNAGVTFSGTIEQTPTSVWDHCMAVNARAPFILCRQFLPLLRNGTGRMIINISSVVGVKGYARQTAYTASKHALRGFSIALAEELAPEGITVHVICPGGVDTDLVRQVRPDIPQDQLIRPEEIARVVIWLLASDGQGVVDEIRIRRRSARPWF